MPLQRYSNLPLLKYVENRDCYIQESSVFIISPNMLTDDG